MFVRSSNSTTIIVHVYVDDIIIIENNEKKIINIKNYLKNKFDIKDLENFKYFLELKLHIQSKKVYFYLKENILLTCEKKPINWIQNH
jgi:Reverse transcriptase (RNA-dependent DNA polymerase)